MDSTISGGHEKTHVHIKRAQLLIIVAIGINLAMFMMMYSLLSSQISNVNSRVNSLSTNLQTLDYRSSQNFEIIGSNLSSLSGGLNTTGQQISMVTLLLQDLNTEISKVGNESRAGIQGIKAELNYTGTIDTAMDAVVLVIWTDKESVVGSGFVVSDDGYIMTANHVVDEFDGKTVRVRTRDGDLFIASVEEQDEEVDVAVLKIDAEDLPFLEFGDSDELAPGSKVFALGAPEGFAFSASEGIVSAVRTVESIKTEVGLDLGLGSNVKVVQTDAAITNGNSGGPLIDKSGKAVGVNSFGISRSQGGSYQDIAGLNFAISINDAEDVLESVM